MTDELPDKALLPEDSPFEDELIDEYIPEAGELPPLVLAPGEPILSALLRDGIAANWPGDSLMTEFCELVLPCLVDLLSMIPAKGGDFALQKAAEGSDTTRYAHDQSLRAHILNGLFAALHINQAAVMLGSPAALDIGDYGRRLIIAGYILHDYNKMPDVKHAFKEQFGSEQITPTQANIDALYAIIYAQTENFRLPEFFAAGGHSLSLDDLAYVIHNTQGMWGTLPLHLLNETVTNSKTVSTVRAFTQMADLLAYGTFLEGGTLKKINDLLVDALFDPPFKLTIHRITQVTGMVTAYLHNAVVNALIEAGHLPILFAPNGVIYASPTDAQIPDLDRIAAEAGADVQIAAMHGIEQLVGTPFAVGIRWGTQGLKTAPFIDALYTPDRVLTLVWKRLRPHLLELQPRKREQLKVFKKLESGIKEGWEWFTVDRTATLNQHMDERAEALADWLAYAYGMDSRNKTNTHELILGALKFDIGNEADLIETAQKGGVQFWPYLIALRYVQRNPAISPEGIDGVVTDTIDGLLAEHFGGETQATLAGHVELHARQTILLPRTTEGQRERFAREIQTYSVAKVDREQGMYDTVYNIPFGVEQQQDATLPYMPTPYSQRLPLGGSDSLGAWRRGLSGVGVVNMLLMQSALRQPFRFEDRKGKMLYLYPVYYFTVETGDALLGLVQRLRYFDLNDWLKHTRQGLMVDVRSVLAYDTVLRKPGRYAPPIQAMRYPDKQAPTLVQVAVDPGSDATDASSWMNAVFMALILASVVDVKVVVTESPSPLYPSGVAFSETVILDAPHASFGNLIGRQINIDHLLSMLQRLTVATAILRDGYGFDLPQFVRVSRALTADSAYAFDSYRRLGDNPMPADAQRYIAYVRILDSTHPLKKESVIMNHARNMVALYRKFYRAKGYASNAILRPIQATAEVILKSGPANSDLDMLIDAVSGRLIQIDNAIMSGDTQGYPPRGSTIQDRQLAMREFATYFVLTYFRDGLQGRTANLRGDQFNILRLACDAVYRATEAEERHVDPQQYSANQDNESENI